MSDLEGRLTSALHDETTTISARPSLADEMVRRGAGVRRRRRVAGGAACLAMLAVSVPVWRSIDTSASRIEPAGPSTGTSPNAVTPTRSSPALPAFAAATVDVVHQRRPTPHVVGLRTGRHGSYDRVVIDLTGAVPGYHVAYVKSLVGSSGKAVALPGTAFMLVRLTPADAHTRSGRPLIQGPTTQTYELATLRASALVEDFEGSVSFGLGLSGRVQFRVFELIGPSRLVIDLRH